MMRQKKLIHYRRSKGGFGTVQGDTARSQPRFLAHMRCTAGGSGSEARFHAAEEKRWIAQSLVRDTNWSHGVCLPAMSAQHPLPPRHCAELGAAEVPPSRITQLFSATWPKEVRRLADEFQRNPIRIEMGNVTARAAAARLGCKRWTVYLRRFMDIFLVYQSARSGLVAGLVSVIGCNSSAGR